MAVMYQHKKLFTNYKGVDLRSNDLLRSQDNASDMLNCAYRKTGSLSKRLGYQTKTTDAGSAGISVYADVDLVTGQITEEIVSVDSTLNRYVAYGITISYSGGTSATYDIYLSDEDNNFYIDIYEGATRLLTFSLGTGVNETSPIVISNVVTQVDALTDFSCTASGITSEPAAFLDLGKNISIPSGGVVVDYYLWEAVNSTIAAPFATTQTKKNEIDFENATFANVNNILYISTGYDELHKYDGQTLYKAGVPSPIEPTSVTNGAGSVTNAGLKYLTTFVSKDAKGNFYEGIESIQEVLTNASSNTVDVTVDTVDGTSGFNTGCGIVAGAQNGVTVITVDDGSAGANTLEIGDTAYFYDGVEGDYIERAITARSGTTITIAGAAVDVLDNAVISNNLRIAIYRNVSSGTTFSLVAEVPNNSFVTNFVYSDAVADSSLGADYVTPIKQHGLPPKGKYVSVFRNQLVISGDRTSVNTAYYSDIDGPEFFPEGDNSFEVDTVEGDKITGIAPINNTFFVFKARSIHAVTGDIVNDKFRVDLISRGEVGCVAHNTIQEVDGRLFFLGSKGVYSVQNAAAAPLEESSSIEPVFTDPSVSFNFTKAVAINWLDQDQYILYMPNEADDSSNVTYANTSSRIYAFDYYRKAWLIWDALNMVGGMTLSGSKLYFQERRLGSLSGDTEFYTHIMTETGNESDYADHSSAIEFVYKSHWETLGAPSVFKKFLRLKVHSLDITVGLLEADDFSLDVETEQDFIPNTVSSFNMDFSGGQSGGWGVSPWGEFPWGMSRIPKLKNKLKTGKAQAIRVIFKNDSVLENILISGYELEVAAPYQTMMKE